MPPATSLADIQALLADRYAIERELGRGGMGAVYLARDIRLDRAVALKVLPPELASDVALRERFLRETRTAASFSHPNIVPVHEVIERDGVIAFAMGYVAGESVAERVRRAGPLDVRGIVRLLQDVGYALAYAHGRGVVHRDIKPDNIMLDRATGRALLMDFGISRAMTTTVAKPGLTRVGEVVGTPEYMSPEQASGDDVDGRSDLYSLGLVALFALTGRPAITDESTQKILVKQLTELPPLATILRPDLPATLGAAIDRCVLKSPAERFASAESLVEAIDDARLAAPEIPLPVRLFAQEAGTLGLILAFLAVITPFLVRSMGTGGNEDFIIPLMLIVAVALTRIMQTSAAARRIAMLGFSPSEMLKGMRAVVDEREGMRQHLRADPEILRRRRSTVRIAALQVPLGILLFALAISRRTKIGPLQYHMALPYIGLLLLGVILVGIGTVLFLRSPMRTPVNERLFRLVWLGPIGRLFLRLSVLNVARSAGSISQPVINSVSSKAAPSKQAPDRLAALEARLAALERERKP